MEKSHAEDVSQELQHSQRLAKDLQDFKDMISGTYKDEEPGVVKKQVNRTKNRVPTFTRDHSLAAKIAHSSHQKKDREPPSRLPIQESITPSPLDTQVSKKTLNFASTKSTPPAFSMSSRYNKTFDFASGASITPAGPNTYDTRRERQDALSTRRQTHSISLHSKHDLSSSCGPGAGKYSTNDAYFRSMSWKGPQYSFGRRFEKYQSHTNVEVKEDIPAPIDYLIQRSRSQVGFKYNLRQKGCYFDRPCMLGVPGLDTPGPGSYNLDRYQSQQEQGQLSLSDYFQNRKKASL